MIHALILAVAANPIIHEIPIPEAKRIDIQIVVKFPADLSPRERAAMEVLRDTVDLETDDYSREELTRYSLMGGGLMRSSLAWDHLRIGFSMPPTSLDLSGDIVFNLVAKSKLRDEELKVALDAAPFRRKDGWSAALSDWSVDYRNLTVNEIKSVYRRWFRPENLAISVAGPFKYAEASESLAPRFESWKPERAPRAIYWGSAQTLFKTYPHATVALWGLGIGTNLGPSDLLAATMGLGKSSSVFRTLRQQLGLSYRQEAIVCPGPAGLRVGVVFQNKGGEKLEEQLEPIKSALKADIEAWSEDSRKRVLALQSSLSDMEFGYSTLYLSPGEPVGHEPADRAYWAAYAAMNGLPRDREKLSSAWATVPINRLKELGLTWLDQAKISVIR